MQAIEVLGLIFGLLYIVSMIVEKWYSWPFGIIAVSLYGYSCFRFQLYGESLLQIIYVILAVYGFLNWKKKSKNIFTPSNLNLKQSLICVAFALILSLVFYLPLKKLNSSYPHYDALSNGFSIIATYLATRKKIENWLIWIPVNILVSYIMYLKEMPFYLILYISYGLFAAYGYYQWKKSMEKKRYIL